VRHWPNTQKDTICILSPAASHGAYEQWGIKIIKRHIWHIKTALMACGIPNQQPCAFRELNSPKK